MAKIGSFGKTRGAVEDTFDYFGEEVRIHPDYTALLVTEFLDGVAHLDETDPDAAVALKNFSRQFVHPDDFDRFWQLALSNRQDASDLMEVYQAIGAALTGRPTQRPSDSSDGPPSTEPKSLDGSLVRGLDRYEGRADLQQGLVLAFESRSRNSA